MTLSAAKKVKPELFGLEHVKAVAEILDRLAGAKPQTPEDMCQGMTVRMTKGGIPVGRLHYSADPDRDPELNPDWKIDERKTYTSQPAWEREQEIVDEAGGGELVFADTLLTWWKKIVIEDPSWRPDPEWDVISGGFDHGKTNPTCLLRAYVDFRGTIIFAGEYYMPGKEIWQHARELKRMVQFDLMKNIQADRTIFQSTSQQSQRPGHAPETAKSFADLYHEAGITELVPFGGADNSDVSFAGRLMMHWADLEKHEPTVKIVCRPGLYADKPVPGLYHWDCPNLLWELMVARRVKLTAQQLLSRNTSEAIVDKDNHARDAMKYVVMTQPEPSQKTLERRVTERVQEVRERALAAGATADQAATNAMVQLTRIMHEEQEVDEPQFYSGNARRRIQEIQRRRNRGR